MAAFDLQVNPAHPSLSFHKLDKAKDKNFRSIRVTSDIRMIVHRNDTSLLLCYIRHHDDAYQWAERRRMETQPKTGAAQLVEIRERVQEITVPKYVEEERIAPRRKALPNISEGTLLSYGVPEEWLAEVLDATEDELLEIAGHHARRGRRSSAELLLPVSVLHCLNQWLRARTRLSTRMRCGGSA